MTRKRYIGLLMGYGYTRNLARARAAIDLLNYGHSYARAFAALEPHLRVRVALRDQCARSVAAWRQLGRTARDIIDALSAVGDIREVPYE